MKTGDVTDDYWADETMALLNISLAHEWVADVVPDNGVVSATNTPPQLHIMKQSGHIHRWTLYQPMLGRGLTSMYLCRDGTFPKH